MEVELLPLFPDIYQVRVGQRPWCLVRKSDRPELFLALTMAVTEKYPAALAEMIA